MIGKLIPGHLWIYDSRKGRWLQVDPLADKYAGFSPYNYSMNNPLRFTDLDGRRAVAANPADPKDDEEDEDDVDQQREEEKEKIENQKEKTFLNYQN